MSGGVTDTGESGAATRPAPLCVPAAFPESWRGLLDLRSPPQPHGMEPLVAGKVARARPAGIGRRLIACALSLGVALAVAAAALISELHTRAVVGATHELENLSLVLAAQADRSFEAVELLQTTLLERVQSAGLHAASDFRRHMSGEAVHEDLRSRTLNLPQLDAITAIDADGNLINFSRYWPIPKINVSDRDYFKAFMADPRLTRFISTPVRNRGTGTWTIYVARKVAGPDGEFLGLILGAVEMAYFERLYEAVARNAGLSVALFRRDGIMLARFPQSDANIGRSFADAEIFRALAAPGVQRAAVRTIGQTDGQERLIAAHELSNYPLAVTASATVSTALADWRQSAIYLVAAAILIELVILAVCLLLRREFRSQQLLADARTATLDAEAARHHAEAGLALAQERERANRELRQQHFRLGAALGNMSQALCMFDAANRLVVANRRLSEMFDLPAAAIEPGIALDLLIAQACDSSNLQPKEVHDIARSVRRLIARRRPIAWFWDTADGRALSLNFQPMEDHGWLVTIEDVTERRKADAQIAHMAHHDALTGLPNRALFHKRLSQALARGRRGETCAVLCLDLDRFKAVNDTLGHPVGDSLLRAVTERLQGQVRETDTIARLGGDEFAIVQTRVDAPRDPTMLATRLIESLSAPYDLDGHRVLIGVSIGIVVAPADADDPHEMLKNADLALYRAKAEGRGQFRYFEPEMDARMQARRLLELDLREALEIQEFEVFYQPLVQLQTGVVSGFEALLRWRHPERGLVSPAEFVPLAEEIGLIVPLGMWVLRRACADAVTWPGGVKVAVNLSAAQFASRTLVEDVADALSDSGLPASRLELEITEGVMLEDTEATLATLHRLRGLGVAIAMDDFGTGYSSLSYLRRFPFDKVKVDRSFIEGLGKGGDCEVIIGAVTELCRSLGIRTTAEGIETEAQLELLRQGQCSEGQGYLFSRPCPADEVPAICRALQGQPKPVLAAAE